MYFFNSKTLKKHNIKIMDRKKIEELFNNEVFSIKYLNYYGTFTFGLFNTENKLLGYLLKFLNYIQYCFNIIFRVLFRARGCENPFLSPHLIAIIKYKKFK